MKATSAKVGGSFGRKLSCGACGARFYDLNRPDPRCPRCGEGVDLSRERRVSLTDLLVHDEEETERSRKIAGLTGEDLAAVEDVDDDLELETPADADGDDDGTEPVDEEESSPEDG